MANRKGTADRGGQADAPEGPYIWPNCYEPCLRTWCEVMVVDPLNALLAADAAGLTLLEAAEQVEIAAEIDRRRGQVVRLRYWQLPFSECPLAEPWPFTGFRCFIVSPDDTVAPNPDGPY